MSVYTATHTTAYISLEPVEDPKPDPDPGPGAVALIDLDSDLGRALVKAAMVLLGNEGIELEGDMIALNRVKLEESEFIEVVLHAKDADGNEMTVLAEVEQADDGSFEILNVDIVLIEKRSSIPNQQPRG